MAEPNDNEPAALIERDEQGFFERFRSVISKLADEGIECEHRKLGYVKSMIRQCTEVNVPEDKDGIDLIKNKKERVAAEEEGREIIRTELVIVLRYDLIEAHYAINRLINK